MKYRFIILSAFLVFVYSCESKQKKYSKRSASGASGEILVVADKPLWEGAIGSTLRDIFQEPQYGLPQPEPKFDMVNLLPGAFTKLFKSHRNLFIINIDKKFKKPLVEAKRNVWSQPQMVVKISAANPKDIPDLIKENAEEYMEQFLANERIRVINAFDRTKSQKIINKLEKGYGLSLTIPTNFFIAKTTPDFAWVRHETKDLSLGITVHVANYKDTAVFNHDNIIELRNKLCKEHIPGPLDSSYMSTESDERYRAVSRKIDFAGHYAVETIGLWKTVKAFMAGPFVRYTILDEERNRVVTLEGFVYAPRFEKRNYLRQVEAILHTLSFDVEKNNGKEQK